MRKTIPKPKSQTDGCGQSLGCLDEIKILRIWRSMVASDSLCVAKGSTFTSESMPKYFEVH